MRKRCSLLANLDSERRFLLVNPYPSALPVWLDSEWEGGHLLLGVDRRDVAVVVYEQNPCAVGVLGAE